MGALQIVGNIFLTIYRRYPDYETLRSVKHILGLL